MNLVKDIRLGVDFSNKFSLDLFELDTTNVCTAFLDRCEANDNKASVLIGTIYPLHDMRGDLGRGFTHSAMDGYISLTKDRIPVKLYDVIRQAHTPCKFWVGDLIDYNLKDADDKLMAIEKREIFGIKITEGPDKSEGYTIKYIIGSGSPVRFIVSEAHLLKRAAKV